MKRIMTVLLACMMTFSLAAAEQSTPAKQTAAQNTAGFIVQSPGLSSAFGNYVYEKPEVQSYLEQLGIEKEEEIVSKDLLSLRRMEASGTETYPVTGGDVLRLTYMLDNETVEIIAEVDESLSISLPTFGTVSGRGKTLAQLRKEICLLVETFVPYSNPQVTLQETGMFSVSVNGEGVKSARTYRVWGLSRLSDVLDSATPYASTRNVVITHRDGTSESYDIYAALKEGQSDQNPLLKAGDVITFNRADRMILVSGYVYNPGTYQIEKNEDLHTVLERYCGGILPDASRKDVRISRRSMAGGGPETIEVNLDARMRTVLLDHDEIFVQPQEPSYSSITIEGAVRDTEEKYSDQRKYTISGENNTLVYQYMEGETYRDMVKNVSSRLLSVSDLKNSYVERDGQKIPMSVEKLLYSGDASGDMKLELGDKLVIPYNANAVIVQGAVHETGVYPYVQGKNYNYYVSLAGGFEGDIQKKDPITIVDKNGVEVPAGGEVPPGATIHANRSGFNESWRLTLEIVGLTASILSIAGAIISLVLNARKL